jgi:hypothetical protein
LGKSHSEKITADDVALFPGKEDDEDVTLQGEIYSP